MFTSETKVRVRYAEADPMGVVYHSNFFNYFEVARTESVRELGYSYAEMERAGVIMPVVEVHAKFMQPALYDDLLHIKTILKELPAHHKIEFHHEAYNEAEELLAAGRVVMFFMEAKTMKRTVMPAALRERLETYFT